MFRLQLGHNSNSVLSICAFEESHKNKKDQVCILQEVIIKERKLTQMLSSLQNEKKMLYTLNKTEREY